VWQHSEFVKRGHAFLSHPGFHRDRASRFWHLIPVDKLTAAQIKTALTAMPEWQKYGKTITRTFVFKDFPAAIKFVNAVAKLAEKAWHHPDIDIRWNKVTLVLTTHDAGGLTEKDFKLAQKFDQL
jgi:4a-hydroxytetrahydrobiopterin dehydratase